LPAKLPFPIHPHMLRPLTGYKLANQGEDTRSLAHYLGHRNLQSRTRYTRWRARIRSGERPLAAARRPAHAALAAAAMDGRLYAVGGRIDGNYSRNLASNEAYDPATDRWEQRAPMPTARSGIAAAVLEGRMFV